MPSCLIKPSYKLPDFEYNYSYYPVAFENEEELLTTRAALQKNEINTRRYFYPSLNNLSQVTGVKKSCPISEDISGRVLCLPLYPGLSEKDINKISETIRMSLS